MQTGHIDLFVCIGSVPSAPRYVTYAYRPTSWCCQLVDLVDHWRLNADKHGPGMSNVRLQRIVECVAETHFDGVLNAANFLNEKLRIHYSSEQSSSELIWRVSVGCRMLWIAVQRLCGSAAAVCIYGHCRNDIGSRRCPCWQLDTISGRQRSRRPC